MPPAFETVRSSSSRWLEAQNSCGNAHWNLALRLRERGSDSAKEAEAEVQQALAKLNTSLKARKDARRKDAELARANVLAATEMTVSELLRHEDGIRRELLSACRPLVDAIPPSVRDDGRESKLSRLLDDLAAAAQRAAEMAGREGRGQSQNRDSGAGLEISVLRRQSYRG